MVPSLPCVVLDPNEYNRNFSGREDVLALIGESLLPTKMKMVSSESDGLKQFALCGLGGLGKTEIALEFVLRNQAQFDAVFWVRADAVAKLNEAYSDIASKLGLEDPSESRSHVVSRELLKGWLSKPWKANPKTDDAFDSAAPNFVEATWLVVFDNADDPYILTDYWPSGAGSILITSRDPLAKNLFSTQPSGLDLEPFSDDEGSALLTKLTQAAGVEEDMAAKHINERLGGLPLAISQMASVIQRQYLSLAEFLEIYEDRSEHAQLHGMKFDLSTKNYPHSMSTVWAFEKLSPSAKSLLNLIAFLDPDGIQEQLLSDALPELYGKVVTPISTVYREARTELIQASLVKRNKLTSELSVHRIVQDVLRAKLADDDLVTLFGLAVRLVWTHWPSAMPKPSRQTTSLRPKTSNQRLLVGRWPACAALYPHVLKLNELWVLIAKLGPTVTKLHFAALLTDAAW